MKLWEAYSYEILLKNYTDFFFCWGGRGAWQVLQMLVEEVDGAVTTVLRPWFREMPRG